MLLGTYNLVIIFHRNERGWHSPNAIVCVIA